MRPIIPIICAALTGILLGVAPSFAAIQNGTSDSPSHEIVVTGTGQVMVKPDTVYISLGVTTQGKEAAVVGQQNATKTDAVIKAIKAGGIPDADIRTEEYRLNPTYDYTKDKQVFTGYLVSNTVQIKVRTTATAGKVLDLALKAGANTVNSVTFGIADSQKAQDDALAKAILDATRKAKIAAKTAGVNSIRLLHLRIGEEPSAEEDMGAGELNRIANNASSSPLRGGRQSVTVTVTARFVHVEPAPILTP
ncbi:MAG: SIMPL domain-containing protein [Akkermansiaceae bacterium]|nr:SIMPL domain-containing protein [Armatimonadota bacterium]